MVEFLSAEWITAFDTAARAASGLATEPPFVVETLVRSPGGDRGYQVCFAAAGASVTDRGVAAADVVLITDPTTAWALHQGTLRAQDAFAAGALKVRGRPEVLVARAELLTALAHAVTPLRAETRAPADR